MDWRTLVVRKDRGQLETVWSRQEPLRDHNRRERGWSLHHLLVFARSRSIRNIPIPIGGLPGALHRRLPLPKSISSGFWVHGLRVKLSAFPLQRAKRPKRPLRRSAALNQRVVDNAGISRHR